MFVDYAPAIGGLGTDASRRTMILAAWDQVNIDGAGPRQKGSTARCLMRTRHAAPAGKAAKRLSGRGAGRDH